MELLLIETEKIQYFFFQGDTQILLKDFVIIIRKNNKIPATFTNQPIRPNWLQFRIGYLLLESTNIIINNSGWFFHIFPYT